MKIRNRVCQITVACEWKDPINDVQYDFSADVILSKDYEVESVEITSIDGYKSDQKLDRDIVYILSHNHTVRTQLEATAGRKALEKAQEADFEPEGEQ